ncbi:MAG: FecCD family ABC transporter permease [Pseudonocardiaceae bacterium]
MSTGVTGVDRPAAPTAPRGADRPVRRPIRNSNALRMAGLAAGLLVLAGAALLSLAVGARAIPPDTVLHVMLHDDGSTARYVVWGLRGPRTLVAVAVGAALGVAGALMQALTRNPLADPGVLGINAGSATAVVIAIGVLGVTSPLTTVWFALGGAAVAGTIMFLIASGGRGGASPVRLALSGMAVTAALLGITQGITLLNTQTIEQMRFWTVGSLLKADGATLVRVVPFIVVGTLLALALARPLNTIALGEDASRSLGANLALTRFTGLVAITLLCGASTAAVGPLMFVGLAVPHMVRTITGPDQRWVLPYCVVFTPILLLVADVIGRVVAPEEIDVGVVTAVIGAPVFIALVRRARVPAL